MNNNVNNENKINVGDEKKDENKKEEKNDEIQNAGEIGEKKLENNIESINSVDNNLIGNKKIEEENVKLEPENKK